ncbi:MAG TPA: hypoxanthine phosphoribosyltransferase [Clostridiales bacterium]|jgi:hypoxanthine phosphoribosyltransferase|nr:hypoxanthine phosphoribosyltransferase [Clostridiales bacterium]
MNPDVESILISQEELGRIITRLASEIERDYSAPDKRLVLVSILKGSVIFAGALMTALKIPAEIEFMRVSSYGAGTVSSGNTKILLDFHRPDLPLLDLLIVENIIDSGRTLSNLTRLLLGRGARSVKSCTLLDKPARREVPFEPDYIGAVIPDRFVVGFGLDYDEKYRNLPYVGVLKPEIYNSNPKRPPMSFMKGNPAKR